MSPCMRRRRRSYVIGPGLSWLGFCPSKWSQMLAEIAVSECALDENEQKQDVQ